MTQASFYQQGKSNKDNNNQGIYFQMPEEELARQLHKRKQQEYSKARQADKLITENQELKELKQKIQLAYLNKERTKQMAEKQVRKVDELVQDAEYEVEIFKKKQEEERRLHEIQQEKIFKRMQGKDVLKRQMQQKADKEKQAYDYYLKEKQQVQAVMQTLLDSEMKEMAQREDKKKKSHKDMQIALELKQQQRKEEAELIKRENQRYLAYAKQLDGRQEAVKKFKEQKEQAKNKIFQKLKVQEENRRRQAEELQNLRRELYQEEHEAQARKQERQEAMKRQRQKHEMIIAQREARERKRVQKLEEEHMENQFRKNMLVKFAQHDKIQQMAQQKRRIKQQQHKREIERLWQEKLTAFRMQKQREERDYLKAQQDKNWEETVIKREKEKLLKEHLPNLQGFLPKDLAKVSGTLNKLERTNFSQKFKV